MGSNEWWVKEDKDLKNKLVWFGDQGKGRQIIENTTNYDICCKV